MAFNCKVFMHKNQKVFKVGKLSKFMKKEFFCARTFSSFQKASLTELEGTKYFGGLVLKKLKSFTEIARVT